MRVDRTVTEARAGADDKRNLRASRPLKDYRAAPAYVLLGDPGAGKTTALEMECEALADSAYKIDARDFVTFEPEAHPEWGGKTLFIDALDEVRAGSQDARTPLDAIRRRLDQLGRPRFRLSCREADWLGDNDRTRLASVVPYESEVTVLSLDPLQRADVARILDARGDITNAAGFVDQATAQGVGALLGNPLTLHLLADVASREGQLPRSRLELFVQATRLLTEERNEEHRAAEPQLEPDKLVDAAGRLCAIALLSGAAGYGVGHRRTNMEYIDIGECEYEEPRLRRSALATRLFTAKAEGCFVPVHRHVGEYVGAKHLARVISEDLPAARVVALLTGFDGGVVTSMRGVAAWLATLSEPARRDVIERDPIGVISYGDAHAFSTEHKEILLQALGREESGLDSFVWTDSALGAIAARGMEPALRKILEFRNDHPPMLVALVLFALRYGERLPSLAECLMQVVYGDNRWPQLAAWALEAFVHNCPDQDAALDRLEQLLQELSTRRANDSEDQLMGVALLHLYPVRLPPAKIWDYLTESTSRYADDFGSFWRSGLIERSGPNEIAILLDELVTRRPDLKPALDSRDLKEVPIELLARGLELRGDSVDQKRLLTWLRVTPHSDPFMTSNHAAQRVGAWLGERPETQKVVVADFVASSQYVVIDHDIPAILYGSSPPSDFGDWSLQQARAATERRSAETYLRLALARGVPVDILLGYESEAPPLREIMKQNLVCPLPEDFHDRGPRSVTSWREESGRRRQEFVEAVQSHATELRANRASFRLLDELANVYFGGSSDIRGNAPHDRLRDLFGAETCLIDATLAGFRGAPFRSDMPEPHEIIGLLKTGRRYRAARPVLAGVDELAALRNLTDRQLRRALAFHFGTFTDDAKSRGRRLLETDPAAAAEVLVQCTTAKMRGGTYEHTVGYELAVGEYVALAGRAVLPLLRTFPVRCANPKAMTMLDELFVAALLHADRATFLALAARKLACTSMSVAQRLRWLAVQVVAAPDMCVDHLRKFVARRESGVTQLAAFLLRVGPQLDDLPTPTLVAFIELLGRIMAPWDPTDSPGLYDTSGRNASECMQQMIRTLSDRPDQATGSLLGRLAADPALGKWRHSLVEASERQRVIRRDAGYRHASAELVCETLNGGVPANAGDLAALVTDRLHDLAIRISTGNTDDWRQYWNEPHGQEPTPKHEEHCRDALLSALRPRLPDGVDAQPECQYANDKRADICVAFQRLEVPVEIKKNRHRDLWSAARNQLIAQYTSAREIDGYGVYLVFWFGRGGMPPPPEGSPPVDPDELRVRLEGTLTEAERRKIAVVVIDVSRA